MPLPIETTQRQSVARDLEGEDNLVGRDDGDLRIGIFQRGALLDAAKAEHGDNEEDAVDRRVVVGLDQEGGTPAEVEQARQDVVEGAER